MDYQDPDDGGGTAGRGWFGEHQTTAWIGAGAEQHRVPLGLLHPQRQQLLLRPLPQPLLHTGRLRHTRRRSLLIRVLRSRHHNLLI
jgi:hypothetical protein